jgi:hypothetical protein
VWNAVDDARRTSRRIRRRRRRTRERDATGVEDDYDGDASWGRAPRAMDPGGCDDDAGDTDE